MSKSNSENAFEDEKFSKSWLQNVASNPDLLSELSTIFTLPTLTQKQETQYNQYLRALENVNLTKQQQIIWELFSLKCYTVTRIAKYLDLHKSTISRTLHSIVVKLKDECKRECLKNLLIIEICLDFKKALLSKDKRKQTHYLKNVWSNIN